MLRCITNTILPGSWLRIFGFLFSSLHPLWVDKQLFPLMNQCWCSHISINVLHTYLTHSSLIIISMSTVTMFIITSTYKNRFIKVQCGSGQFIIPLKFQASCTKWFRIFKTGTQRRCVFVNYSKLWNLIRLCYVIELTKITASSCLGHDVAEIKLWTNILQMKNVTIF